MSFTYEIPDERLFFTKLLEYLDIKGHSDIAQLLRGGYCTIQHGEQYAAKYGGRWNAFATTVYFYIRMDNLEKFSEQMKKDLIIRCDELIPKNAGLDVMAVEFSPLLEDMELSSVGTDKVNLKVLRNHIGNHVGEELNKHSLMRLIDTDSLDYLYRLLGILDVKYIIKKRFGTEFFVFESPKVPTHETITEMSKRIEEEVLLSNNKIKCFFCYADDDASQVKTFYEFFTSHEDFNVFFAKKSLKFGDIWKSEIKKAIKETDFFILFVSQKIYSPGYFNEEIREAIEVYRQSHPGMPYFLPIKLEPCNIPSYTINSTTDLATDFQWIEVFREDFDKNKLIEDIRDQWRKKQRFLA